MYNEHKNRNVVLTCHPWCHVRHLLLVRHHASDVHMHPMVVGDKLLQKPYTVTLTQPQIPESSNEMWLTRRKAAAVHEPPARPPVPMLLTSARRHSFICFEYSLKSGIRHTRSPVRTPACATEENNVLPYTLKSYFVE